MFVPSDWLLLRELLRDFGFRGIPLEWLLSLWWTPSDPLIRLDTRYTSGPNLGLDASYETSHKSDWPRCPETQPRLRGIDCWVPQPRGGGEQVQTHRWTSWDRLLSAKTCWGLAVRRTHPLW